MNELINTFTGNLNGESQSLVNANDLHTVLGVETRFDTWFQRRIEQYGFSEQLDFCSNLSKSIFGRPKTEYHLSLDMAKELCLVENTEQGKKARRYFIEVEKLARREIPAYIRRGEPQGEGITAAAVAQLQALTLKSKPLWRKVIHYYKLGLTQTEIGKLVDMETKYLRSQLVVLNDLGFIQYHKNLALAQAGAKGLAVEKANHQARLAAKNVH